MTRRVSQDSLGTQGRTEIWDLLAPPTGTATVSVTLAATTQVVASAVGFGNVNQTGPSRSSASTRATSNSISLAITSAVRDAIVDVISVTNPITPTPGTGQTLRWNVSVGSNTTDLRGAGSTKAGVGTFDGVTWGLSSSTSWSISAESIQPPNAPTLAKFVTLDAFDTSRGTLIRWRTGYEVENLGFRLWREDDGERIAVNQQLIAGSALFAGPTRELRSGRSYSLFDSGTAGRVFSTYWLEDIALDGESSWNGPYLSRPMAPEDESRMLAEMDAGGVFSPTLAGLKSSSASAPVQRLVSTVPASKVAMTLPWNGAWQEAAKILVSEEGWYRVTRAQLTTAGFDPGPDATNLQLFAQGVQHAIRVSGLEDGCFDPEDAVEFYGLGLDLPATASQVFWLVHGAEPGLRVEPCRGSSKRQGQRITQRFFDYTVERRDRTVYVAGLTSNGDRDNFYGVVVTGTPSELMFNADYVQTPSSSGNPATLSVVVQGLTAGQHRIHVELNDHDLGELLMTDEEEEVFEAEVDFGWLLEGQNTLRLTAIGGDTDVSVVDVASLTYERPYMAVDDALSMSAGPGAIVRVGAFTNPEIEVMDVSDETRPLCLPGRVLKDGSAIRFITPSVTHAGSGVVLYAFSENAIRRPDAISANIPSQWGTPNHSADLLIISPPQFLEQVEVLATHRRSQGLEVAVASTVDVNDEFRFGERGPDAIRSFLGFAGNSWAKAPRYVLLLGDATFDPRDYLGFGSFDLVPTHIGAILDLKTANDDWFGDSDCDGRPEMAIGRLPVRSAEEAQTVISKIIAYDAAPDLNGWSERLTLIAGADTEFSFEAAITDLKEFIPAGIAEEEILVGQVGASAAHQSLMSAFNEGRLIINYDGHGSQTIWEDGLFDTDDVGSLTNEGSLPLVIAMSCINGLFHDVYQESLAETLLKAPNGGAVAVWASSALTDPAGQAKLNEQFYQRIFDGSNPTVGDALLAAKAGITDPYVRSSWIFFGDPSMKLK